ncbi:MAG: EAL domain-containing protein [Cellvibrionaceae bacterium]|nr:EAL domain-containing protein [Cellvibrionaceae bacterium]
MHIVFPKNGINLTVLFLGTVTILIAFFSSQIYYGIAHSYQQQSLVKIAKIQSKSILKELNKNSYQLMLSLTQDKVFDEAIRSNDKKKMETFIEQNFYRYFVTAGLVKLEKITVYDKDANFLAESIAPNKKNFEKIDGCKNTIDSLKDKTGSDKHRPLYRLCLVQGRASLTVAKSIGLAGKGYIEIVVDPLYNLIDLEQAFDAPISILSAEDGEVIYQSKSIKNNKSFYSSTDFSIVDNAGESIATIYLHQNIADFASKLNSTRNIFLFIIMVLVSFSMLAIRTIMSKVILNPLKNLTRELKKHSALEKTLDSDRELKISHEFSELHELYKTLQDMALTDSLTGLYNRNFFDQKVNVLLSESMTVECILCYMDLDKFKIINDSCGHVAGDQLLKNVSEIFKSKLRSSDILSRIGGDEFGILMYDCSIENAKARANDIKDALVSYSFLWGGKSFKVGISIGLVKIDKKLFPNIQTLLQAVDSFCYMAKAEGGNAVQTFNTENIEELKENIHSGSISKISETIKSGNMSLYCQTVVPTQQALGLCNYHELLVRMYDNNGHVLYPDFFLPLADRYGIMNLIDEWVLKEALHLMSIKSDHFNLGDIVAINVSGKSISSHEFRALALAAIQQANISAYTLCIEITETSKIFNLYDAVNFIEDLKKFGVIFALDDFGTGLSSFDYLKNIPVDVVKIDGSFIKNIATNDVDYNIVQSVKTIAAGMQLSTIAEHVETREQLNTLKQIGIDYAQGYLIARPKPLTSASISPISAKIYSHF